MTKLGGGVSPSPFLCTYDLHSGRAVAVKTTLRLRPPRSCPHTLPRSTGRQAAFYPASGRRRDFFVHVAVIDVPLRGLWQKKCPAADAMIGVSRWERTTKISVVLVGPFGVSRCRRLPGYAWMDTWATKKGLDRLVEPLKDLVGMRGFEPPTTCTPCRYASQAALHPESKSHCTVLSREGQGFCAGKRRSVLTRGSQRGAIPMPSSRTESSFHERRVNARSKRSVRPRFFIPTSGVCCSGRGR